MDLSDWVKRLFGGGPDNKKFQMLALVIVAAIAVIMLSGTLGSSQTVTPNTPVKVSNQEEKLQQLEDSLQTKIASALEKVEGVGKVTVAVTLSTGPRSEYGVNQTHSQTVQEETPQGGGKRTSTQTNDNTQMVLAGTQNGGGTQPVQIVEVSPQIAGVLVVAEGAKNPYILERVQRSVQTLLGIPASKIRVEPLGTGGGN